MYPFYYDDESLQLQQNPLAQRVAILEASVRQQNQRIRDLERRVRRFERTLTRSYEVDDLPS